MTPDDFTLEDFNIKSVTGGTDSLGMVRVKIADEKGNIFTGVSSELDIVMASAKAYLKAINKLAYAKSKN